MSYKLTMLSRRLSYKSLPLTLQTSFDVITSEETYDLLGFSSDVLIRHNMYLFLFKKLKKKLSVPTPDLFPQTLRFIVSQRSTAN